MHWGKKLTFTIVGVAGVRADCNPLEGKCDPVPGFASEYFIDFTATTTLPTEWIIADSEVIKFGSNGAELTVRDPKDAPNFWTARQLWFGRVEVVLRSAPGIGIITSSVLISNTQDEIDWEWSGNNFDQNQPTVQTNYFGKGITSNWDRATMPHIADEMTTGYHTYTVDWTPTLLTWSIDGNIVRTLDPAKDCNDSDKQYPQTPMRLQVGAWDAGGPDQFWGTRMWAGGDTPLNSFPYTGYAKSVKITPYSSCPFFEYIDTSGSKDSIKCLNMTSTSTSLSESLSTKSTVSPVASSKETQDTVIGTSTISVTTSSASMTEGTETTSTESTEPSSSGSIAPSPLTSSEASASSPLSLQSSEASMVKNIQDGTTTVKFITSTTIYTITSCKPEVKDCPAKIGQVTTETILDYTTICPVSSAQTPASSSELPRSIINDTETSAYSTSVPFTSGSTTQTSNDATTLSSDLSTSLVPSDNSSSSSSEASAPRKQASTSPDDVLTLEHEDSVQSASLNFTTSTVYSTRVFTILSCASDVSDCRERGKVTTEIVSVSITVCPVTETESPTVSTVSDTTTPGLSISSVLPSSSNVELSSVAYDTTAPSFSNETLGVSSVPLSATTVMSVQAVTDSPAEIFTTSTVFSTVSYPIKSCSSGEVDCTVGQVTTEIIAMFTTICPVADSKTSSNTNENSTSLQGTTVSRETSFSSQFPQLRYIEPSHSGESSLTAKSSTLPETTAPVSSASTSPLSVVPSPVSNSSSTSSSPSVEATAARDSVTGVSTGTAVVSSVQESPKKSTPSGSVISGQVAPTGRTGNMQQGSGITNVIRPVTAAAAPLPRGSVGALVIGAISCCFLLAF